MGSMLASGVKISVVDFVKLDIEVLENFIFKCERDVFDFTCIKRLYDGFVHIVTGVVEFIKGEQRHILNPGDTVFVFKGERYSIYAKEECSYVTSGYTLSEESREQAKKSLPKIQRKNPVVTERIRYIERVWQRQMPDRNMVCNIELLSLYLELFRINGAFMKQGFGKDVQTAIEYVHNNYKRNFAAQEIAEHCSMSPSHLRAEFKRRVGMTITEYRDRLRFSSAKEYLSTESFSIKETAEELGFCDVYYFSRFFRRFSGTTRTE